MRLKVLEGEGLEMIGGELRRPDGRRFFLAFPLVEGVAFAAKCSERLVLDGRQAVMGSVDVTLLIIGPAGWRNAKAEEAEALDGCEMAVRKLVEFNEREWGNYLCVLERVR